MIHAIVTFLMAYGYWGMFAAAFLAGSFFPFSSEAVILGLLAAGLEPAPLIAYATVGNVLGSMVNYWIGRQGRLEWVERYLHVSPATMERTRRFMAGHGAWMGFFAFLPVLGSAITILLGLTRANFTVAMLAAALGKWLRYAAIVYGADLAFSS